MPPLPNNRLLRSPALCALCDRGKSHLGVIDLSFNRPGKIRLCHSCFENLVDDKTPYQCSYCGSRGEYGTWKVQEYRTSDSPTRADMRYIPDYWLFCESHFRELEKEVMNRPIQTKIWQFDQDGYRGYVDLSDALGPMRRRTR